MESLLEHIANHVTKQAARAMQFSSASASILLSYITNMKEHDPETYMHSLRTAIYSRRIARKYGFDSSLFFFIGLSHDIGKIETPKEILRKKKGFTKEDWTKIKQHPESGFHLLHPINKVMAEIVYRIHIEQEHGYPENLPLPNLPPQQAKQVETFTPYISLADAYDACTTRDDEKLARPLTKEETHAYLLAKYPKRREMIKDLFKGRIF